MSLSRIKTIVIAALILINLLFAAVIIIDTDDIARSERLAVENAAVVLRNNEITIYPVNIKAADTIRTMRTERGHEVEEAIARAVLGPVVMTDLGVIFRYINEERGAAEFSSAGEFEIQFNKGVITNSRGALRTVQSLLQDMKIETSGVDITGAPGNETVTAIVSYRGVGIFNCTIEFVFSEDSLEMISGRYVTVVEATEDGAVISTASTTLLSILSAVKAGQMESSRVDSVEAGYHFRTTGPFGEGVIAPAWLITTDTGRYIIDDATGEIEMIQ